MNQKIVIIAGPNGAGKTTFAKEFLPREADCPDFINPELAVARVAARVSQGGHHVPEPMIRRRFDSGLKNFRDIYQLLVNSWALYDNSGELPHMITMGDNP